MKSTFSNVPSPSSSDIVHITFVVSFFSLKDDSGDNDDDDDVVVAVVVVVVDNDETCFFDIIPLSLLFISSYPYVKLSEDTHTYIHTHAQNIYRIYRYALTLHFTHIIIQIRINTHIISNLQVFSKNQLEKVVCFRTPTDKKK